MPQVHQTGGFRIYVYRPPSEHGPPHVHVLKDAGEVVVRIGTGISLEPYRAFGQIKRADVIRAIRIVESLEVHLLEEWRKYHDE
jgi:hypothetical protein